MAEFSKSRLAVGPSVIRFLFDALRGSLDGVQLSKCAIEAVVSGDDYI